MTGIPPQFLPAGAEKERFRQLYGVDSQKVNIGVVGTSGTGKSSLLNSLRGLTPRSQGAAATGINETTNKVQGYPDTRNPNIIWYDVPGANTTRVKGWSYFVDHGLYCFDVLVVVFDNRFTQTAVTLLSNANRCFIPTLLVRTKADQLINNYIDDARDDITKEEAKDRVAQSTRQKVQADLERAGLPNQRVYIVSKAAMKELVASNHCSPDAIDEKDFLKDINPGDDEDDEDYETFDGDT
ncbi:interferon-inducible GTPase-domain-containing protein [Panaeolus papilionaceus]|nr:interferon-inducible GTPase-domain-containing protein [Panaeolus papilionaceus]